MKIQIHILLAVSLSASLGFADRINFGGAATYPDDVTLAPELIDPPQTQEYGACHIYAAVSAAQAACYRKSGERFNISPGYLFYRHLRVQIDNPSSDFFLSDMDQGMLTQNDAGFYGDTLDRIKNNSVMLESEYNMSILTRSFGRALEIRKKFWRLKNSGQNPQDAQWEALMRSQLRTDMDQEFAKHAHGLARPADNGFNFIVSDMPKHPLNRCGFSQLQYQNFQVTPERAVALINQGIPFLCQFYVNPNNQSEGQHVVLFAGYTYRPGLPDNIGFWVRDSRLSTLLDSGWSASCSSATVVYNPEEAALVNQLINL